MSCEVNVSKMGYGQCVYPNDCNGCSCDSLPGIDDQPHSSTGLGHTRYYSAELMTTCTPCGESGFPEMTTFDFGLGPNWLCSAWPYLTDQDTGATNRPVVAVLPPMEPLWFDAGENGYTACGHDYTLTYSGGTFLLVGPDGSQWHFKGFAPDGPKGRLISYKGPGDHSTYVTGYTDDAHISGIVSTHLDSEGNTVTESYTYTYEGDEGEEHLTGVTLSRNGMDIAHTNYEYATGTNTLQRSLYREEGNSAWKVTGYYRYNEDNTIKYTLGAEDYLDLAVVADPLTADDSTVSEYASLSLTYDAETGRVATKKHRGGAEYSITTLDYTGSGSGYNQWVRKTTTTGSDGTVIIEYVNYMGQMLIQESTDGEDVTREYWQYDDRGHLILNANSAAIATLTHATTGTGNPVVTLSETEGLIRLYTYYTETDSSSSSSSSSSSYSGSSSSSGINGAVVGYKEYDKIKNGNSGKEILLKKYEYTQQQVLWLPESESSSSSSSSSYSSFSSGSFASSSSDFSSDSSSSASSTIVPSDDVWVTIYPIWRETVYSDEDGENPIITEYNYNSWHPESFQPEERVTILPAVSTDQNGSGVSATRTERFDHRGNLVWLKDERGIISYNQYDILTGNLIKSIQDVDENQLPEGVSLPDGWSTWLNGWSYRKQITVNPDNVDTDLSNFPLLVAFDDDANIGSKALSNGDDIRFTLDDGSTELKFEREQFTVESGEATGRFWVKVPSIDDTDGATIYLYYGKSDAGDVQDAPSVWDGYAGVWHLGDSGGSSADEYRDSTGNGNHGTGDNMPEQVDAKILKGQDFEDSDSETIKLGIGSLGDDLDGASGITCTAWLKPESLVNWGSDYVFFQYMAPSTLGFSLYLFYTGQMQAHARSIETEGYQKVWTVYPPSQVTNGTWHHVAARADFGGDAMSLFRNGSEQTVSGTPSFSQNTYNHGSPSSHDYIGYNFDGIIDEMRVYAGVLSDAWIKFEYCNINEADNELTWSEEEETAYPLCITTDYEYDSMGRATMALGPLHTVDIDGVATEVRTASWTVYDVTTDEVGSSSSSSSSSSYYISLGKDEIWSAQGYQTIQQSSSSSSGSSSGGGENVYTLVNPVSITRADAGGRTTDSIQAVWNGTVEEFLEGNPDSFPQSSYVSWATNQYGNNGQIQSTRTYHTIPDAMDGEGSLGTHYDQSEYGYDSLGRQNMTKSPGGTIARTVFDARGRAIKVYIGTDDTGAIDSDPTGSSSSSSSSSGTNNMVLVSESVYAGGGGCGGCGGGGAGNLIATVQHVDDSTTRITEYLYDWRDRQEYVLDPFDASTHATLTRSYYDNLDRVIMVERYRDVAAEGGSSSSMSNSISSSTSDSILIARSETLYDNRGQVYRTQQYAVDPSIGTVGNALESNLWYDAAGNVVKQREPGSQAFTKTAYDGLGRAVATYYGYDTDETSYADALTIDGDTIVDQSETTYDDAGNVILSCTKRRIFIEGGTGELNLPSGSSPKARSSFQAFWHDGVGRMTAVADYGALDSTPTRPDIVPASSDTVLVTTTDYNDAGQAYQTTDPKGTVNRIEFDDAGRQTKTIQNYLSGQTGTDKNITVETEYNADGQVSKLIAHNSTTGNQETRYVYGTDTGGITPEIYRNDLLRAVIYPDSDDTTSLGDGVDGYDRVEYKYNRQGERIEMKDQNGTVHAYSYDYLGRLTADVAGTLGTGIDDAVRRIERTYEVRGMVETITSYGSVDGNDVVNQVEFEYNELGKMTKMHQEHDGPVDAATLYSGMDYDTTASSGLFTKGMRPIKARYPNGRHVHFEYFTSSMFDNLNRIFIVRDDDNGIPGDNLSYYMPYGADQTMVTFLFQPGLGNILEYEAGEDSIHGLDRFDRVIQSGWHRNSDLSQTVVKIGHGYDRAGNRLYREDHQADSNSVDADEFYTYDGAYRLTRFQRGDVTTGTPPSMPIGDTNFQEYQTLDPTGNWWEYSRDKDGDATLSDIGSGDEMQHRVHNKANETTAINKWYGMAGRAWATPAHDRAGNMTETPQPAALTDHYHLQYDAWNRLVEVRAADDSTLVAGYEYDGLNHRTVKETYDGGSLSEVRYFYYNNQWQVLEERADVFGGSSSNSSSAASESAVDTQYVWGLRYVDDLILRDRDTTGDGTLNERLYALQDANWNVVALAEPDGTIAQRFIYDAYGKATPLYPDFTTYTGTDYNWPYLFTGRRVDEETGLMQYRNRYYHIQLGRFVTRDPIGYRGGINLYSYASGQPVRLVDPSGSQAGPGLVVRWSGSDAIYIDAGIIDLSLSLLNVGIASLDVNIVGGLTYLVNCRSLEHGLFAYFGGGFGFSIGISPIINQAFNVGIGFAWNLPGPIATEYDGFFYNIAGGGGVGLVTAPALGPAAAMGAYIQGFTSDLFHPKAGVYGYEFGWKGTIFPSVGVTATATHFWTIKTWKLPRNHLLIRTLCCAKNNNPKPANNAVALRTIRQMASVMLTKTKAYEAMVKQSAAQEGRKYLHEMAPTAGPIYSSLLKRAARGDVTARVHWGKLP